MKESKYIWKNGELIDWNKATTHVLSHSLHYGSSVFEGIRAYSTPNGPAIFKAEEHFERLHQSADYYHFKVPYTTKKLISSTKKLILENNLKSCYIRPLVYFGYDQMGIMPYKNPVDTIIAVWEWGSYLGNEAIENGIKVRTSSYRKIDNSMLPSQSKCSANYANSILAKQEALSRGYNEALLLNKDGNVSEGPGENIFIIKNDIFKTPAPSQSLLNGITAQTVTKLARDLGFKVSQTEITLDEIYNADEVFFTGTAAEITPIIELDDKLIANGKPGILTKRIQDLYFKIVKGEHDRYTEWLTYV